jgi:hypothetical protein
MIPMKKAELNSLVVAYKKQLDVGKIQVAYTQLVKFVMSLKTRFSSTLGDRYSFGAIFQGYMDYTYFYFANDFCRERKLKFGLVLNHEEMRFEIWLLGQTKDIQERYWKLLKNTKWIQDEAIPKYSVFAHVLVQDPDFDDLGALSETIEAGIDRLATEILESIDQIKE